MVYNKNMALPESKYAVYYGTIRLNDGSYETYTAEQIAEFYEIADEDYLAIPLIGPSPFHGGQDELSYVHLKPLSDGQYYDARQRYNVDNEIQWDEDFDARRGGKWAVRPEFDYSEDVE